jgi:hypothetical protein
MAKLNIKIEQINNDAEAKITVKFSSDVPKDDIFNSMREMFDVEMLTAEIMESSAITIISIKTSNEDKIQLVKTGMLRVFREKSGLNNITNN